MQKKIRVGARGSPLSKAQAKEILLEVRAFEPELQFEMIFVETTGDRDRKTSLRDLDKTDFFTKELDLMLLEGTVDACIHSAKDLPDPIPTGLTISAVTQGVDPSDSLVLREGEALETLPKNAVIATSSVRREEAVKSLRSDLTFIDLRGTIQERLHKLESKEADGVVVAEAALIRLGLTHLNRIRLPGDTTPMQGKLAVLCRSGDNKNIELFTPIDTLLVEPK